MEMKAFLFIFLLSVPSIRGYGLPQGAKKKHHSSTTEAPLLSNIEYTGGGVFSASSSPGSFISASTEAPVTVLGGNSVANLPKGPFWWQGPESPFSKEHSNKVVVTAQGGSSGGCGGPGGACGVSGSSVPSGCGGPGGACGVSGSSGSSYSYTSSSGSQSGCGGPGGSCGGSQAKIPVAPSGCTTPGCGSSPSFSSQTSTSSLQNNPFLSNIGGGSLSSNSNTYSYESTSSQHSSSQGGGGGYNRPVSSGTSSPSGSHTAVTSVINGQTSTTTSNTIYCGRGNLCVPHYLCQNGYIVDNGQGVFQVRSGSQRCDTLKETCCRIPPSTTTNQIASASYGGTPISQTPSIPSYGGVKSPVPSTTTNSLIHITPKPGSVGSGSASFTSVTSSHSSSNSPGLIHLTPGASAVIGAQGAGRVTSSGGSLLGSSQTLRPNSLVPVNIPQNTTPYPGCAAALKCVREIYCNAEGVMVTEAVYLSREQQENRVPLTDCSNPETGEYGKCCRDPNYKDPWPDMLGGNGQAQGTHEVHTHTHTEVKSCGPFASCVHAYQCNPSNKVHPIQSCRVPLDGASGVCCATPSGGQNLASAVSVTPAPGVVPVRPGSSGYSESSYSYNEQQQQTFTQDFPQPSYSSQQPNFVPHQQTIHVSGQSKPQTPSFVTSSQYASSSHSTLPVKLVPSTPKPAASYPRPSTSYSESSFVQSSHSTLPAVKPAFSSPKPASSYPRPSTSQSQSSFVQSSHSVLPVVNPAPSSPGPAVSYPRPSSNSQSSFVQSSHSVSGSSFPNRPNVHQTGQTTFTGVTQGLPQHQSSTTYSYPQTSNVVVTQQRPSSIHTQTTFSGTTQGVPHRQPSPSQPQPSYSGVTQGLVRPSTSHSQTHFSAVTRPAPSQPLPSFAQTTSGHFQSQQSTVVRPGSTTVSQISNFPVQQSSSSGFSSHDHGQVTIVAPSVQQFAVNPGTTCGVRRVENDGVLPDGPTSFGEFPWHALIVSRNKTGLCSGVLVSNKAVLTAAHCVNEIRAKDIFVKLGEWKRGSGAAPSTYQEVGVIAIAKHPDFQPGSLFSDLALLLLSEPARPDRHVDVVCLPERTETFDEKICVSSGWGRDVLQGQRPGTLYRLNLKIQDDHWCEHKLRQTSLGKYFIFNKSFNCATGDGTTDICKIDVGGPLICDRGDGHYVLAGINSWDVGCTNKNSPSVFAETDVDWINSVLSRPASEFVDRQNDVEAQENLQIDTSLKPGFSQGYGKK